MSICPNCGAETSDKSFCERCGAVLASSDGSSRDVDVAELYASETNGPKFETFGDENPPCPNNVLDAYGRCLRDFSKFGGRACQSEFWYFHTINYAVVSGLVAFGWGRSDDCMILAIAYSVLTWLPSLAVSVRRCHDSSSSGWLCSAVLLPLALIVVFWERLRDELLRVDQGHELLHYWEPSAWVVWALLTTLGVYVYIGLRPGSSEPNRYGMPPERRES